MNEYTYVTLRQMPELKDEAAAWFHDKWKVPQEAYLECMEAYLKFETEYGWYLCLDQRRIVGGLGVIENDFHDRKDLTPNVCAVYTEKEYRCQGIAGQLLDIVVEDMKSKGTSPIYLITDHTDFYERYGWEFLCMFKGMMNPICQECIFTDSFLFDQTDKKGEQNGTRKNRHNYWSARNWKNYNSIYRCRKIQSK